MRQALLAAFSVLLVGVLCGATYVIVQLAWRGGWWFTLIVFLAALIAADIYLNRRKRRTRR